MCYSARILADYRRYLRDYDAPMSLKEFVDLFWRRAADPKLKIPKAMELAFDDPQTPAEVEIKALIDRFNAEQVSKVEAELFRQRKRLADAQRSLREKSTKAALESERIANGKVEWALGKLADLRRHEPIDEDSRIFPLHYAPVMVIENGRRTIKPMRYGCRLAGKPASHDIKFPGTYNARRDSLDGFWKGAFGVSHGLVVMDAFFENVNRHRAEGRALGEDEKVSNVILEFKPASGQPMLVACLWSRWSAPGEPDLLSFAAITDEPPPEIASAGPRPLRDPDPARAHRRVAAARSERSGCAAPDSRGPRGPVLRASAGGVEEPRRAGALHRSARRQGRSRPSLHRSDHDKWPHVARGHPRQPRRAASIFAMSIFFIVIIASNTRLATLGSGSQIPSVNARGVICHDTPHRSLHQPHSLSWPPLPTIAFHRRSVSSWLSVAIWNENASLCLKIGPPFSPTQGMPATVNSTVSTSPCLPSG